MTSKEIAELRLLSLKDFICLDSEEREAATTGIELRMLIREIAYQLAVANEIKISISDRPKCTGKGYELWK